MKSSILIVLHDCKGWILAVYFHYFSFLSIRIIKTYIVGINTLKTIYIDATAKRVFLKPSFLIERVLLFLKSLHQNHLCVPCLRNWIALNT